MTFIKKIIFPILIIFLAACGKYPEGPEISFRTKDSRLCQTWELIRLERSDGTVDDFNIEFKFEKSGNVTYYRWNLQDSLITLPGEWTWLEDKDGFTMNIGDDFLLSVPFGINNRTYIIQQLKSQEMIFYDKSYETYFYFIKKTE